jgi:hypothetical protein
MVAIGLRVHTRAMTACDQASAVDTLTEELCPHECLHLLAGGRVGRVAVTMQALPVVLPVNASEVTGRRLDRVDLPWVRGPSGYL